MTSDADLLRMSSFGPHRDVTSDVRALVFPLESERNDLRRTLLLIQRQHHCPSGLCAVCLLIDATLEKWPDDQ